MEQKKKIRILSLDGGGIRGIIPATIIKYAENYLNEKAPGTTIADHFDFVAGSSTGGILSCIYLTPEDSDKRNAKFTAAEALDFYEKEGYNIFNASKLNEFQRLWGLLNATNYDPKYIESLFLKRFGETKMSELLKPCLITTYNMKTKSAYFFTSNEETEKREFYVRDVARSTSAAPTFFPPAKIKNLAPNPDAAKDPDKMINLDGGVFANNPLMCAFAEVRNTDFKHRGFNKDEKPTVNDMQILSIGTGGGEFKLKNKKNSESWSVIKWAKNIPNIMMDGSVDTVDYQMKELFSFQELDSKNYLRIDVPQGEKFRKYDGNMADASPKNIADLITAANKTLDVANTGNKLDKFLDDLLD